MSKKYSHLWQKVIAFDNLKLAYQKAARGKRGKAATAEFEYYLETNLSKLQEELRTGNYQPGKYVSFYIKSSRLRIS